MKEKREYSYHDRTFTVLEDIYYCPYCKSELIYNLDDDLKRIYSEYLILYESTVTSIKYSFIHNNILLL